MSTRARLRRPPAEADNPYRAGYLEATRACAGRSVASAWEELPRKGHRGIGYLVGYRTAVWDFERAHGLTPGTPPPTAYGG